MSKVNNITLLIDIAQHWVGIHSNHAKWINVVVFVMLDLDQCFHHAVDSSFKIIFLCCIGNDKHINYKYRHWCSEFAQNFIERIAPRYKGLKDIQYIQCGAVKQVDSAWQTIQTCTDTVSLLVLSHPLPYPPRQSVDKHIWCTAVIPNLWY